MNPKPLAADANQVALGRQQTVEFYDCDAEVLLDTAAMERLFLRAAAVSGATVVKSFFHAFVPQGVSGVVIISESHFAVHAWPEHEYAAVDLFTCGATIDFESAIRELGAGMRSRSVIVSGELHRGILGNNGLERVVPVYDDASARRIPLSWQDRFRQIEACGISCAVDLIGVPAAKAFPDDNLFWENFGLKSAHAVPGAPAFRVFDGGGWAVLTLDAPHNRAHVDVFSPAMLDPRAFAEAVLRWFGAAGYRLQVALRK